MEDKQTAVQWLFDELIKHNGIISHEIIEKAIAMEKEQIIEAYNNGEDRSAELYYNETYGEDQDRS
jgi:hypothetical protein